MNEVAEILERASVPALDAILGQPFPLLNDGHIRIIDYLGNDAAIVQAARTSYGKGTKAVSEDRGLIRYLMRHWHTTPFEMCELKIHIRAPMDMWRQWIRHRTASVNEYSTRYSEAIDSRQTTPPGEWRSQSKDNKQGSGDYLGLHIGEELTQMEAEFQAQAINVYNMRLSAGVAREQARKDLPLSTYTEAYWKVDLHNLLHFLYLRMDSHAQKEIRDYATVLGKEIVRRWVPFAWEAFEDYRLYAMQLSRLDIEIIGAMNFDKNVALTTATKFGWLNRTPEGILKPNRERQEFEWKVGRLNMVAPWLTAA